MRFVKILAAILVHLGQYIQGYPQRKRLQIRLYVVQSVCLHSGFHVGKNLLISVLNYFVNHQNTQLNVETKYQASNRHIFRVLLYIVFTVSSFVGNPLLSLHKSLKSDNLKKHYCSIIMMFSRPIYD